MILNTVSGPQENPPAYLTKSTVDALGHINIVPGRPSASIGSLFRLDGDGLRRADSLAQFAGNAPFFATGITTQGMLTAEPRAQRSLLERIVDGGRLLENVSQSYGGTTEQFRPENGLRSTVRDVGHLHALFRVVYIIELLGFDAGCLRSTGVRTAGHRHRRAKDAVRCGVINLQFFRWCHRVSRETTTYSAWPGRKFSRPTYSFRITQT